MSTSTVGTGTMTLGAAVAGFLTFAQSGAQDGDVVAYAIRDGTNSEIGYGTYTAATATLTRNVRKSTNSDAAISLSGRAEVVITPAAEDLDPYSDGEVSILRFIPENLHAAILAGTSSDTLTTYFQQAIDYLETFGSTSARPALRIPAGLYVTGALTCDKNIEFVGDGRRCTFIRLLSGVTSPMLTLNAENVAGTSLDDVAHYAFRNLTLVGNRTDLVAGTAHGLSFPTPAWSITTQYSPSAVLQNVEIHSFTGSGLDIAANRNWLVFDNVIVRYCNVDGLAGASYDYLITNSTFGPIENGRGLNFGAGGGHSLANVNVFFCNVNVNIGSFVDAYVNWQSGDCGFAETDGLTLGSPTGVVTIGGVTFRGNSSSSAGTHSDIVVAGANTYLKLLGNTFEYHTNNVAYGVEFSGATPDVEMAGNIVKPGTSPFATGLTNQATRLITSVKHLKADSGWTLNIASGDWVATHTTGILTVGTGDLRVTTAGTNAASAVTVGGTQTLTNKTLTSPTLATPTAINTTDNASVQVARFDGDRATPTDGDTAYLSFMLSNDGGTQTEFFRMAWTATDVNDGTNEDGQVDFHVMAGGSLVNNLVFNSTVFAPKSNDGVALGTGSLGFSDLFLAAGGEVRVNNVKVLSTQQAAIANLAWTYSANDPGTTPNSAVTFADGTALVAATAYEAFDEIEGKINAILAALRTHGIIAT